MSFVRRLVLSSAWLQWQSLTLVLDLRRTPPSPPSRRRSSSSTRSPRPPPLTSVLPSGCVPSRSLQAEEQRSDHRLISSRLQEHIKATHGPEAPVVIQITAGSTDQLYFFATCGEGSNLDNKSWVERKKASVVRWGISTGQFSLHVYVC